MNAPIIAMLCTILAATASATSRDLLQTDSSFPPYTCEKNPAVSPYYMEPPVNVDGNLCFTVQLKAPTAISLCNQMDFYKLELEVEPSCRKGIKFFFVNGVQRVTPTPETFGNGRWLIKFPQVNLDITNASGAVICMQPEKPGQCITPASLCTPGDGSCTYAIIKSGQCNCCPVNPLLSPPPPSPSPPSPSPPSPSPPLPSPPSPSPPPSPRLPFAPANLSPPPPPPFPYCQCDRTAGGTPFSLAKNVSVDTSSPAGNIYTFIVLSDAPVDLSSSCANTTLYKAEFWSTPTCYRAVKRSFVNGNAGTAGYDSKYGLWKITSIGFQASVLPGPVGTIGFQLDANGPCPTLEALCRGRAMEECMYALFDDSKKCCPLGEVNVPLL